MTIFIRKPLVATGEPAHDLAAFMALPPVEMANYTPHPSDWKQFLRKTAQNQIRKIIMVMPDPITPSNILIPHGIPKSDWDWYGLVAFMYDHIKNGLMMDRFATEDERDAAEERLWTLLNEISDYERAYISILEDIELGAITTIAQIDVAGRYVSTTPRVNPATIQGQAMHFNYTNIGNRSGFSQWGGTAGVNYQVAHGAMFDGYLIGAMLTFEGVRGAGQLEFEIRHGVDVNAPVTLPTLIYSGPDNAGGTGNATDSAASQAVWEFGPSGVIPRLRYPKLNMFKVFGRDVGFTPTGSEGMFTLFFRNTPPVHVTT